MTLSTTAITVASLQTLAINVNGSPTNTVNAGSTATLGASLVLSPGTSTNAGANFTMADSAIGIFNLQQSPSFVGNALTVGGTGTAKSPAQEKAVEPRE